MGTSANDIYSAFINGIKSQPITYTLNYSNEPPKPKTVKDEIKQTIYNNPATIIEWTDGTKTVVKTSENDDYDPVYGFLMSYFQKHCGLTKTQVGKFCDGIIEEFAQQQEIKLKGKKKRVSVNNLCIANEDNDTCVNLRNVCCFVCNEENNCKENGDICSLRNCKKYKK